MKNKKLFDETISILVNAYLKDELRAYDCKACAVGNLCNGNDNWGKVFSTNFHGYQEFNMNMYQGETKKTIDDTGYTVEELALIEYTFETNTKLKADNLTISSDSQWYHNNTKEDIEKDQFNGLMAVVDVLMEIHECNDEQIKKETKELFVK